MLKISECCVNVIIAHVEIHKHFKSILTFICHFVRINGGGMSYLFTVFIFSKINKGNLLSAWLLKLNKLKLNKIIISHQLPLWLLCLCLMQAGLCNESKPRQLALAMEPECAALYVRGLQCEDLLLGEPSTAQKYIVVDVGAGTVDVAVHEVKEHEKSKAQYVHELESCIGNARGAKTIDDTFENFMQTLEVKRFPNFFSPEVYYIWDKIMNNFQIAKENYELEDNMTVELPNECFSRYKERVKKGLEDVLNKANSPKAYIAEKSSHYLCIPKAICLPWYSSTCNNVMSIVRDLSKKYCIKVVFIVGGFADCEILWKALRSTDPDLDIVIPDNPGLAVVKGAVKYGPIPKAIASRRSHATYGVKTCEQFDETKHAGKPKVWSSFNNAFYCHNIFRIFVRKGEEVDPSQLYSRTHVPMKAQQTGMTIQVFASDSTCPKYITDDGCLEIGKLHINIKPLTASATKKDDNREVQVAMDFSGPEIFVRITDITDGKKGATDERTLDFLPVENYTVRP